MSHIRNGKAATMIYLDPQVDEVIKQAAVRDGRKKAAFIANHLTKKFPVPETVKMEDGK